MASIFDVATYILNKIGTISTMKLQKLCYYSQAWSLAWDGVPLFEEEFEAWANGPVSPALFCAHKGYFVVDEFNFKTRITGHQFTKREKETLDAVLDYYGNKDPQWLSNLTHLERPWKEARGNTPIGERCQTVIIKDTMQEYYGALNADGQEENT